MLELTSGFSTMDSNYLECSSEFKHTSDNVSGRICWQGKTTI